MARSPIKWVFLALALAGPCGAERIQAKLEALDTNSDETAGRKTCTISEKEESLGYGVGGSYESNCIMCKPNIFIGLLQTDIIQPPEIIKDACQCKYASTFYDKSNKGTKKWFSLKAKSAAMKRKCTPDAEGIKHCYEKFQEFANKYGKTKQCMQKGIYEVGDCAADKFESRQWVWNDHIYTTDMVPCSSSTGPAIGVALPSPGTMMRGIKGVHSVAEETDTDTEPKPKDEDHEVDETDTTDADAKRDLLIESMGMKDIVELYEYTEDWWDVVKCEGLHEEDCEVLRSKLADDGQSVPEFTSFQIKDCADSDGHELTLEEVGMDAIIEDCGVPVVGKTVQFPSESASESAGEPAGEPADEPAGEPASEPAGEPASEPASEPVVPEVWSWDADGPWGEEKTCEDECADMEKQLQEKFNSKVKLLTYALKGCKSNKDSDSDVAEKCEPPALGTPADTFLPIKIDVSPQYDENYISTKTC